MPKILVIGGVNIDIETSLIHPLIAEDSNVGHVHISLGGVGYNIASHLALYGSNVTFLTCLGNDPFTPMILHDANDIHLAFAYDVFEENNATYVASLDHEGNLMHAVIASKLDHHMTPQWIDSHHTFLEDADFLVVDANLPSETLWHITKYYSHKKIIAEGVSTSKVMRLKGLMSSLFLLKCNQLEAIALFDGMSIEKILETSKNQKYNMLITSSSEPVKAVFEQTYYEIPHENISKIISVSGAGDAYLSGFIAGMLDNALPEAFMRAHELASEVLQIKGTRLAKNHPYWRKSHE